MLTAILKRSFIRVRWREVSVDMLLSNILSYIYTNAHAEREKKVYTHKKETDRSKILTASSKTVYLCIGLLLWKYIL